MQSKEITIESPKLKVKGSITTEIDTEINLPYFCKLGRSHFVKINSKNEVITVDVYSFSTAIEISTDHLTPFRANCVECSEEEFNEAFQTAFSKIQNLPK
jgi:hypothetical protein